MSDPDRLKILRYIPTHQALMMHPQIPPKQINPKFGLTESLYMHKTRSKGWTVKKEWFASSSADANGVVTGTEPVIHSIIVREFATVGTKKYPRKVTETMAWVKEDGKDCADTKVMTWPVEPSLGIELAKTARSHQITDMKTFVLGMLAVIHAGDIAAAAAEGDLFLKANAAAIERFVNDGGQELEGAVQTATEDWLDQDAGGSTPRSAILEAIDIWGP